MISVIKKALIQRLLMKSAKKYHSLFVPSGDGYRLSGRLEKWKRFHMNDGPKGLNGEVLPELYAILSCIEEDFYQYGQSHQDAVDLLWEADNTWSEVTTKGVERRISEELQAIPAVRASLPVIRSIVVLDLGLIENVNPKTLVRGMTSTQWVKPYYAVEVNKRCGRLDSYLDGLASRFRDIRRNMR